MVGLTLKLPNRRDAKPVNRQAKTHFKPGQTLANIAITDLAESGQGIAKVQGKTLFVEGAVPGDQVTLQIIEDLPRYTLANVTAIEQPSPDRIDPFCPIYATCGGCQLQHLSISAQRHWKQQHLQQALTKLQPKPAISWVDTPDTPDRHYRRRAKLILGRDWQTQAPLLGFRSAQSHQLIDVAHCPILSQSLNNALAKQRDALLTTAPARNQTLWLTAGDKQVLTQLGDQTTQDDPATASSSYQLKGLRFYHAATSFIQVNHSVNEKLVAQALNWLALDTTSRVIDFFCGLGNFSLPAAQQASALLGIEGNPQAVAFARHNAQVNNVHNAEFKVANLFDAPEQQAWWSWPADCAILDPGRAGAEALCQQLGQTNINRIVYVSCHTGSLTRDLALLIAQGFSIERAQQFDMFSHTKHSESLILLRR